LAIISYKKRFIYLLNPRTASTATGQALRKATEAYFVPARDIEDKQGKIVVPRKHTTIKQLREHEIVPEETLQAFFKFVTVRNPFDSLVSAWSKKVHDYSHLLDDPDSWVHKSPNYAEGLRRAVGSTFAEWIAEQYDHKFKSGRGASMNRNFIRDVDHVLRYETLEEDFREVAGHLDMGADIEIPRSNVTKGRRQKDYRSYYDEKTREIVASVFREEIDTLGYEF